MPAYFIDNCCNRLFINELITNPILMEYASLVSDSIGTIEIGIFLKHILRNNIKQDDFNFYKELNEMKKLHNCSNAIRYFKKNIYNAVEQHYSQNSLIRKIKFRFNKANIIKKLLYKILDNIIDELKNTNNLVFKKVYQYLHITHQE